MSVCFNAVRAVSRSRIPPSKTLLPFLYQTATIQQWRPTTRPIARRNITSRPRQPTQDHVPFGDEIPFDDSGLPPPIDQEPARKTTITSTERTAFQKLYRKFKLEGRQQKPKEHVVELDQVADEYYDDEDDSSKPSLDKVFNEALQVQPRVRAVRTEKIRATQQQAPASKDDGFDTPPKKAVRSRRARGDTVDAVKFKEMRQAERERIDSLIRNAPTDHALWKILDREVFTRVRDLDLDNANTSDTTTGEIKKKKISQTKLKPDPPTTEASILFQNYPHHLVTAVHTLRTEFPSSPLPLSILPTIKNLGRSSHALGGTPALYKNLIRTAWIQQSSYTTIDSLLKEMDHHAIEFDADILTLLETIIRENNEASSGLLGKEMQMVFGMEMFVKEMLKIKAWKSVIAKRLGVRGEEKRTSDRIVRRVVPEKEKLWRGVQPAEMKERNGRGQGGHSGASFNDGFNDAFTAVAQGKSSGGNQKKGRGQGRHSSSAFNDGFNDAFTAAAQGRNATTSPSEHLAKFDALFTQAFDGQDNKATSTGPKKDEADATSTQALPERTEVAAGEEQHSHMVTQAEPNEPERSTGNDDAEEGTGEKPGKMLV
ncbi:nadh:flavin oxidoreductase nadh oxidase [Pyrenophora seminiperda CCB06]|uniref:Nadh:flavin oxidoreductase nadh oxidase n=1 Tax=Pyrenophora seminiperda CCB06 TaxID=1302712 RepID=A0A3M7MGR0_9PLEO|nr:nadh:flavin oxidoreductase nadh oxidase [Pyrenophora seminiperda CCB06]